MSDLISREEATKLLTHNRECHTCHLYEYCLKDKTDDDCDGFLTRIFSAEKVGVWVKDDSSPIAYRCTACGVLQHWSVIQNGRYHYCPNCGARMERSK